MGHSRTPDGSPPAAESVLSRLMKHARYAPPVAAVIGALGLTGMSAERTLRTDICHVTGIGTDNVQLITIADQAVAAHLAHGDFFPTGGLCLSE